MALMFLRIDTTLKILNGRSFFDNVGTHGDVLLLATNL